MSGSQTATTNTSPPTQTSSTAGEDPILTPSSTPSTPLHSSTRPSNQLRDFELAEKMGDKDNDQSTAQGHRQQHEEPTAESSSKKPDEPEDVSAANLQAKKQKKTKCRNPEKHKTGDRLKKKDSKNGTKEGADDDDSSHDSEDNSDSSSSDDDSKKLKKLKAKLKNKKSVRKNKKAAIDSDTESSNAEESEDSSSSSSSEDEPKKSKLRKKAKNSKDKKSQKGKSATDAEASVSDAKSERGSEDSIGSTKLHEQVAKLMRTITESKSESKSKSKSRRSSQKSKTKSKKTKKTPPAQYKRVDQLWDSETHQFKLKESTEDDDSEFAEFAFLVRRTFTWENQYQNTVIDIKSKQLRAPLAEVMKDCKSVSLEAEEPVIDPNILFLYLEELRTYYKKTLKAKMKAEKKRKAIKKLEHQRMLLKTLIEYIDEDYEDTKKTLYPLLKAGNITFDLIWALFHPGEIAVTSTYGIWDEARCFQVEYANKHQSFHRGEWYCIEGRYMEYDGKAFGYGDFEVDIESFKGPRKITSLNTYPLKYHKDPESVKKQIIARAEKFINMEGMHYKSHKGLAFVKKKKQVLKININGRIMVDPATFRRVNPNYPISIMKPKEAEDLVDLDGTFSDSDSENECSCSEVDSDNESAVGDNDDLETKRDDEYTPKYKYLPRKDKKDCCVIFERVEVDDDGDPIQHERIKRVDEAASGQRAFTEEDMLLTSPVVLGFAFSEKLWLEFTISGLSDIIYNEHAFDSLVLPPNQKSIVRAQVESHKTYAAKTIDDVVQGKGKGLVAVLHGPPGTGKTLTAEGIAELLKCPLYMVSAGELGTNPAKLEQELQKILDIAHTWRAILLLDEADVFLEKREVHDIHRNALVSIFLRLLEYFQGILFLTTNRVETFDDAFQSRIHIALRYGDLTHQAKKTVWKMFLDLARKGDMDVADLSDQDFEVLARNKLNGRQIKNLVRTAQALALNEKKTLTMGHIKRVIEVAESFDADLKGGTGYIDAMRSYT